MNVDATGAQVVGQYKKEVQLQELLGNARMVDFKHNSVRPENERTADVSLGDLERAVVTLRGLKIIQATGHFGLLVLDRQFVKFLQLYHNFSRFQNICRHIK